jgi:hypothetical protein
MSEDEWSDWQRHNQSMGSGRAKRPCEDCLLGFAAEMRLEGRCNGTPAGDHTEPEEEELPVTRKPAVWTPEARAAAAERARKQIDNGNIGRRRSWTEEEKAAIGARVHEANVRKRAAAASEPAVSLQPEAPDVTPLAAPDDHVTDGQLRDGASELLVRSSSSDQAAEAVSAPPNPAQTIPVAAPLDPPVGLHINTGRGEAQAMAWSEGHTEGFIEGTEVDTALLDRYIETLIRRLRHEVAPDVAGGLMDRIERLLGVTA